MYICIDVGGTKTLVTTVDDNGSIVDKTKIDTSHDYQTFLNEVSKVVESYSIKEYVCGAAGIPAVKMDRTKGTATSFGNLPWTDVNIANDLQAVTNCSMYIENDAKLAGLSEAVLVKDQFSKVFYITVSTGIGTAIIEDLKIDTAAGDSGGRALPILHDGKYIPWESFASGRALTERYGKMAKEIEDEDTWKSISQDLAKGLIIYIAIFQPDVVIFGGGVGGYFSRFGKFLKESLEEYQLPLVNVPELVGAQRPEEAVIYGCYELIKQKLNK